MKNTLIPINPNVGGASHSIEKKKDVSKWFETEYLELNFGETTGRPSADVTMKTEYLAQFLQTGWSVDAVLETGESGN